MTPQQRAEQAQTFADMALDAEVFLERSIEDCQARWIVYWQTRLEQATALLRSADPDHVLLPENRLYEPPAGT